MMCHFWIQFAERQGIDEDTHGEADTTQACHCKEHLPCGIGWHFSHLRLDGNEGCQGDADRFSE